MQGHQLVQGRPDVEDEEGGPEHDGYGEGDEEEFDGEGEEEEQHGGIDHDGGVCEGVSFGAA
jgi:hypothetical protein